MSQSKSIKADTLSYVPRALRLPLTVLAGSLVMAVCSQISIPFWPVPMTMQVFATFLLAALLGGRVAAASLVAYLVEGAAGLPVFSTGHSGVGWLVGPTGGYLFAFVAAAYLSGEWIERYSLRGRAASILPMLAGLALVYFVGAAWLSHFIGWSKVLAVGVLPFVPGDLLKVALAALVAGVLSSKLGRG